MRYLPWLLAGALALPLLALLPGPSAQPVSSSANARMPRVDILAGPPPQRDETPGRRRPGYVWVPGYWTWSGDRFVWLKGRYVRSKRDSFRRVPNTGGEADGRYRVYELDRGALPPRVAEPRR